MNANLSLARGNVNVDPYFHSKWQEAASIVEEHDLWGDPFASTLRNPESNPELSWLLVKKWTEQMYHGSLAFPRYVGNLVGRVVNHASGRSLAINAAVERGYPDESRSHFLLAVDLLRAMGLSDEEIVAIPPRDYSSKYIQGHLDYTRNESLARGIGCLGIGIETLTTEEFTLLGNAFIKTAPIVAGMPQDKVYKSQGYFTENIMADEDHKKEFEDVAYLVRLCGEVPEDIDICMKEILEGARYSLDSRRDFFKGVYRDVISCLKP